MDVKISHVNGTDFRAKSLIDWIVGIYEADGTYYEHSGFNMKNPKSVWVIFAHNAGGIIIDLIQHRITGKQYFICQYISVEKEYRRKGIAKQLLKVAEDFGKFHNIPFVGAYVDGTQQIELWKQFGFPHQSNIGFNITMFNKPSVELWS